MPARGKDFGGGATLDSPRAAGDKKVMQVYVSKGGQQYGPYTVEQLRQYVEVGNFAPTDLKRNLTRKRNLSKRQRLHLAELSS